MFLGGVVIVWAGIQRQDAMVTFFGFALLGVGWTGVLNLPGLALPGQGHNPAPNAVAQARGYELELVEQDEASQIRCVVMEFMHRPLTDASIELLESDIELLLKRADVEFSTVLAGGREPVAPAKPADARASAVPAWSCKRDGHIFTDDCKCVHCKVQYRQKEAGVSPAAQKVRYSALDYRSVLIVNGSDDPVATAGYDDVRQADLVVAVKGDQRRVVKDRFGPVGVIDADQLSDIRRLPEVKIVQA
jgi:hypothetical protein